MKNKGDMEFLYFAFTKRQALLLKIISMNVVENGGNLMSVG